MESSIYNQKGESIGKIKLSETVFGATWKADLVHQVVTSMLSSARKPVAHAKTRGEVSGGGKKPWRQKGTGRARHGSTRSPIWVGGGVSHGPRNDKVFLRKVNAKMKAKALASILSRKFKDNEIIFVDDIKFPAIKTKEAVNTLKTIAKAAGAERAISKKENGFFINIPAKEKSIEKSFSNIGNVLVNELRNINPVDVLTYKYLVFVSPDESQKFLESKVN